jgi:hypothetical protein
MSQEKVEKIRISEEEVEAILALPDKFKPTPTHEIVGVLLPYPTLEKARRIAASKKIKLHEYIEQLIDNENEAPKGEGNKVSTGVHKTNEKSEEKTHSAVITREGDSGEEV